MKRKIALFALAALLSIQFIHPAKNTSSAPTNSDITQFLPVPASLMSTFKTACYDCHSNNTHYPWYANIQPVDWWMSDHVKDGKRHFNFDEFNNYRAARKFEKLGEIAKEIEDGEMPMSSYTWMHKDAILNDKQKQEVYAWVKAAKDTMTARFPADSLVKKKK
jgi:Haem-binding domain